MNSKYSHLKIKILNAEYQYSLFKVDTNISIFFMQLQSIEQPFSLFFSSEEISLLSPSDQTLRFTPEKVEYGWSCFRIVGEMPFGTVQGLIAAISSTLIMTGIGVCVVSSFKSDWFFIKSKFQNNAIDLLTKDGWTIEQE